MVIIQRVIEKEIGYRGFKSILSLLIEGTGQKNIDGIVKEQRVDGSRHNRLICLRCTLLNFEKSSALGLYSSEFRNLLSYKI